MKNRESHAAVGGVTCTSAYDHRGAAPSHKGTGYCAEANGIALKPAPASGASLSWLRAADIRGPSLPPPNYVNTIRWGDFIKSLGHRFDFQNLVVAVAVAARLLAAVVSSAAEPRIQVFLRVLRPGVCGAVPTLPGFS